MRLNTNAHAHVIRERRKKKVKKIKSCFNSFLLEQSKKEGIFFFLKLQFFLLQSFLADDDVCEQLYHWTWRSSQEHYEY